MKSFRRSLREVALVSIYMMVMALYLVSPVLANHHNTSDQMVMDASVEMKNHAHDNHAQEQDEEHSNLSTCFQSTCHFMLPAAGFMISSLIKNDSAILPVTTNQLVTALQFPPYRPPISTL